MSREFGTEASVAQFCLQHTHRIVTALIAVDFLNISTV